MENYSLRFPTLLTLLIIFIVLHFLSPAECAFASPKMLWQYFCKNKSGIVNQPGTYNESSQYQDNLNVVLSWVSSSPELYHGFYNGTMGDGEDEVNVIGLCRGDTSTSTCLACLADAASKLPQKCPYQKEAVAYYEGCMLRYSNRPIFHKMETQPNQCLINTDNYTDAKLLNRTRAGLFQRLKTEALTGGGPWSSVPYFATGAMNVTGGNLTLYGMTQCTPDISNSDCSDCIDKAIQLVETEECGYNHPGGRMMMPSCSVRYEYADFFYSQPPPPSTSQSHKLPTAPTKPKKDKKSKTTNYVLAAILPTVAFVALFSFWCCYLRRRKSRSLIPIQQVEGDISTEDSLQFNFNTIKAATDNFSNTNRLGQGGFGAVYKGKLWDGREIAVKRLTNNDSGQGEAQFRNEILLLVKLQHRNLVRLLGYCLAHEESLLIYEFVPNASLDHFLFDPDKHEYLDWKRRVKIINGIARGLLYLHEDSRLRIIHRDLKASNILLDVEMNPKIADFGLAKLFMADQTHADTSRIAGTYGYMAPEYILHGLFSVKADVYSFGILLLEIMCGRRNRDVGENTISLTSLIWRSWRDGTVLSMVDPTLLAQGSSIGEEITRYIHIGLLCVQENENARPNMSMVVLMLSTDSLSLAMPSNPGFISNTVPTPGQNDRDQSYNISTGNSSINEDSFTDLIPR